MDDKDAARHHGYGFTPALAQIGEGNDEKLVEAPRKTLDDSKSARPGYRDETVYAKKHEFSDSDDVLRAKVRVLVSWLRELRGDNATCVYSGAGISTASGIADYASSEAKEQAPVAKDKELGNSPYLAQPSLCHKVLGKLYSGDQPLIHSWVQQNHDGLPQKAGVPQARMNEIHGSIYDPSNPVVPMSGQLRTDLFEDLMHWEHEAKLVLALGTSLSGMNADRVCTASNKRHRKAARASKGSRSYLAGGLVICSLQATAIESSSEFDYDASRVCALRLWCTLEKFAQLLAEEVGLDIQALQQPAEFSGADIDDDPSAHRFETLPYDPVTGEKSATKTATLDLTEDAEVVITAGPHRGDIGEVVSLNREGHYNIRFMHPLPGKKLKAPMERKLGKWWLVDARNGEVARLPIVSKTEEVMEYFESLRSQ